MCDIFLELFQAARISFIVCHTNKNALASFILSVVFLILLQTGSVKKCLWRSMICSIWEVLFSLNLMLHIIVKKIYKQSWLTHNNKNILYAIHDYEVFHFFFSSIYGKNYDFWYAKSLTVCTDISSIKPLCGHSLFHWYT